MSQTAFSTKLRRYLRDSGQHPERLASRLDVPPQVVKRYLVTDDAPPPYLLERLTRVTGNSWTALADAKVLFEKASAEDLPSSTPAENPFKESAAATEPSRTGTGLCANDLFRDMPEKPAETETTEDAAEMKTAEAPAPVSKPVPDAEERAEHLREHIWIGFRLCSSATPFATAVGVSCPSATRWVRGWSVSPYYYSTIAKVLSVPQEALFETPTPELIARAEAAPPVRRVMPELDAVLARLKGESASPAENPARAEPAASAEPVTENPSPEIPAQRAEAFKTPLLSQSGAAQPSEFRPQTEAQDDDNWFDEPIPSGITHASNIGGVVTAAREDPVFSDEEEDEEDDRQPDGLWGGEVRDPGDEPPKAAPTPFADTSGKADLELFVPGPEDCASMLSERIRAFMVKESIGLGEFARRIVRQVRGIKPARLKYIVTGVTIPTHAEVRLIRKLLGISADRMAVEAQMPSSAVMKNRLFEAVAAERGLVRAEGGHGEAKEEAVAGTAVSQSEAKAAVHTLGRRIEAAGSDAGRRGIAALEYGAGLADYALPEGKGILYTVSTSEFRPVFEPGTTLLVSTAGFDPAKALTPANLAEGGWYLLRMGGVRMLRRVRVRSSSSFSVDAGREADAAAFETLQVEGRASAALGITLI